MCGIVGIARFHPAEQQELLERMVATLRHRGPDDRGEFELPDHGLAIGMTRLSIIDLAGGHQPMFDEARRYALVFNGEIYNFRDLRVELTQLGHHFETDHSDTEVVVHGFEQWGKDVFPRLNGMFAVAIWDNLERRLILARDRTGEKPLYLGKLSGGGWVFASELKPLLLHPDLDKSIDPRAVEQFLAFDYIFGPRTILSAVSKVPAGHTAEITADTCDVRPYWVPAFDRTSSNPDEILEQLDALLSRSVRIRMVADVPVGLFLSGGLDSSTIGYFMAREASSVHAFSIGFDNPAYDESPEARAVAAHLGIDHEVHVFSEAEVAELVPRITDVLDEPMGDQSIFPTFLLSEVTRRHVKVALGGDGSDELFMGYRSYQVLKAAWLVDASPLRVIPRFVGGLLPEIGPRRLRQLARLGHSLALAPDERLLARLGSFHGDSRWVLAPEVRELLSGSALDDPVRELDRVLPSWLGPEDRTIGTYLRGYLQEDILVKVDRASMANSLEVRSPFLDPDIVDFALSIPAALKMPGIRRKDLIRRLMRGRLPDWTIDRPKRGFGIPLADWLRSSLAALVDDYLADDRIAAARIFDRSAVKSVLRRHARGDFEAGNQVWLLLQFELWRHRWLNDGNAVATT
jgi:asparagine synthase (glutamine-hydrolysing)